MIKTAVLKINNVLPIRNRGSKVLAILDGIEKRTIFWFLIAILLLLSGLYIYFITQTILNTAFYEKTEEKIAILGSDIGELEFRYISLKKDVNLSLARELGYKETSDVLFINKRETSKTLSLIGKIN